MKRITRNLMLLVLLGAIVNVAVAWGCAAFIRIELFTADPRSTALWNADGYWHLEEFRQAGAAYIASSRQRLTGLNYDKVEREGDPRNYCPTWTGFDAIPPEYDTFALEQFKMTVQLADARGWPRLALWSEPTMCYPAPDGKQTVN